MLRILTRTTAVAVMVLAFPWGDALAQDAAVPSDLLIKLERTACYGNGPVYSIFLGAKGNLSFYGTKADGTAVQHTDRVAISEVAALLATARRIGFFKMRDSYRAMITDLPTTFVTFTANGQTKKIEDYFSAASRAEAARISDR